MALFTKTGEGWVWPGDHSFPAPALERVLPRGLCWCCRLAVFGFLTLKTTSRTLYFWLIFYLLSVTSTVIKVPPVLQGFHGDLLLPEHPE